MVHIQTQLSEQVSLGNRVILHWRGGTYRALQLTCGFHFHSQGISRITCCHPRFRTMRSRVSWMLAIWSSTEVFHHMAPLVLVVLSTLYARIGQESHWRGKLAWVRSPRLMKFPVALQFTTVVVLMVFKGISKLDREMNCSFIWHSY